MLLDSVRSLFGRHAHAPQMAAQTTEAALSLVPDAGLATDDDPVWPSARISVAEALWGEGFLFPGGAAELLHLANPMGLSAASSLLLLGAGPGGATRCIASELGVWVTGYEANARLVALSNERSLRAGLGRRALVEQWSPHAPKFPLHYFHHAMAIEPLHGAKPEEALAAVSLALKPGGQFVLVELVADLALDPNDQMVAAWVRLDHRAPDIPSELRMTRILGPPRVRREDRRGYFPPTHAAGRRGLADGGALDGGNAADAAAGRDGGARGRIVAGALPPDARRQTAPGALACDR